MFYSSDKGDMIRKAADQKYDHDAWLEARKPLITSSDFFSYRGHNIPSWWGTTPDEIETNKIEDLKREFPVPARVSMNHGIHDEDNIRRKFGEAFGCGTVGDHGLYVNTKWPFLGASIDGFFTRPYEEFSKASDYCQDDARVHDLIFEIQQLVPLGRNGLLEIKKSTSTKWGTDVPDYYKAQVQGQLNILDLPVAIIVAETITYIKPKGERRKRAFWDLVPYVIMRDFAFEEVLTEMNDRWARVLGEHGELRGTEDEAW